MDNYGGCVLPRLPQKNFLANLNMETIEFAEVRTRELQRYLEKLLAHGKVRAGEELRRFLFD
jgi:ribosomal protein L17